MIENENLKTTSYLNDAFDIILKIFNKERIYYEKTINSLKGKVSELEESLIQVKKENMSYQSRISKLKGKLRSISKTVSKLEDSDFEVKININNKDSEREEISSNNTNNYKMEENKNNDNTNYFIRKSKGLNDIDKSLNNNININNIENNNNSSSQYFYLKMNTMGNNKLNDNEEDINRHFTKKPHKKNFSTKIKNNILNRNQQAQIKNDENILFKSHCFNDEDVSSYLINDLKDNIDLRNRISLPAENVKKIIENKKKYQSREKYNKIEQKIKGLKSVLSINNKSDNLNSIESFPNSVNIQNTFTKSNPFII